MLSIKVGNKLDEKAKAWVISCKTVAIFDYALLMSNFSKKKVLKLTCPKTGRLFAGSKPKATAQAIVELFGSFLPVTNKTKSAELLYWFKF